MSVYVPRKYYLHFFVEECYTVYRKPSCLKHYCVQVKRMDPQQVRDRHNTNHCLFLAG